MQEEKNGDISPSRLNLQQAKYGCFLVLPLKFDGETSLYPNWKPPFKSSRCPRDGSEMKILK